MGCLSLEGGAPFLMRSSTGRGCDNAAELGTLSCPCCWWVEGTTCEKHDDLSLQSCLDMSVRSASVFQYNAVTSALAQSRDLA